MIIGYYTRLSPQVECKKCVNISKKYSFFLSRRGQHIGRKAPPLHPLSRQGQNVILFTLRP